MDQHAGHLRCIDTLFFEGFYDDVTGFPLIFTVDFCVGHFAGAGNGAVEIVGVGGAGCWNRLARLRPDGGVARVCVHNAANRRECLIEQPVSWRVGGGLFVPSTTSPVSMLTTTISSAVMML